MAKKYDNYGAVAASTTLAAGSNHTNAGLIMGVSSANALVASTAGTFGTTSDSLALTGTTQSGSGVAYIEETIAATNTLSGSIFFTIPAGGIVTGAGPFWAGVGATRSIAFSLLTTEQFRFFSASGGTLFTSTVSGGFTAGVEYRVDYHATVDTSTTGRLVCEAYTAAGTSPISGGTYDSGTTINLGTSGITRVRRGIRTSTSSADDNVRIRFGFDPASAYLMGPIVTDTVGAGSDQTVDPWSTVTLTATSSSGAATWSQLTGTTVTLLGSDPLIRTFVAPASAAGETLTFRATNGSVTDDISIVINPSKSVLVTSIGPIVLTPIRLGRVVVAGTPWTNRAVYNMSRNGTTDHAVDPSSATNLVAGSAFTPTAGRLLVAVVSGSVTSSTPSGWTLPSGGSAVGGSGVYVWYRTAAGSDTFTTTHNASNYPAVVAVYEFPSGTTFVGSNNGTAGNQATANPDLTGLTGTNLVMAVKSFSYATTPWTGSYTWTGTGTPTEDWDLGVASSGTDGYSTSLAYVNGYTGSSWQPTATFNTTNSPFEMLTFAVKLP